MSVATKRILYPYEEASELLGLPSVQALRDLVFKGRGPTPTRIGRRVLFTYADLENWALSHRSPDRAAPGGETSTIPQVARGRGRPSVRDRQASGRA